MKRTHIWLSVFCLALLFAGVQSARAAASGDWEYRFFTGQPKEKEIKEIYITGYEPSVPVTEVVVPETLDSYLVTGIYYYTFEDDDPITSITLPASLRTVVNYSGDPADGANLVLPKAVQHLTVAEGNPVFHAQDDALCQGDKLILTAPASTAEEVHVPEGTTVLYGGVFRNSEHLKRLYLPATVKNVEFIPEEELPPSYFFPESLEAFIVEDGNPVFQSEDGLLYRGSALAFCPRSKSAILLKVREGTELIEYKAFDDCGLISTIQLPASVREVQKAAFSACHILKRIDGLSGVSLIQEGAIRYCWALRSIGWEQDSETYQMVDGMLIDRKTQTLLTMIDDHAIIRVPDGIRRIGDNAMTCLRSMTLVALPASVTEIGAGAFALTNLTEIALPPQVTFLGEMAFYGCDQLWKADLNSQAKVLPQAIFYQCEQLKEVLLPEALETIEPDAFSYCRSLASIGIPSSVTTIENRAFYSCEALQQVTLPDGLTTLGDDAFYGCSALKTITIPGTVEEPGAWCFARCDALQTAVFREGVESIHDNCFYFCSALRALYLPKSLTKIEAWSSPFSDNPKLTAMVFPGTHAETIFKNAGLPYRYQFEGRWKATDPAEAAALGLTGATDIHLALVSDSFTVEYRLDGEEQQVTFPCHYDESNIHLENGYMYYTLEDERLTLETAGGVLRLEREEYPV